MTLPRLLRLSKVWYHNMDRLIKAVNADGRVKVKYSSPNAYVAAKRAESKSGAVTWPLTEGDFFPYADGPHQFCAWLESRPRDLCLSLNTPAAASASASRHCR